MQAKVNTSFTHRPTAMQRRSYTTILLLQLFFHSSTTATTPLRTAGILYEVWHCEAAAAMAQVKKNNLPQLTTEAVLRSNGKYTLNDVFPAAGGKYPSGDIYNAQPALGFYCLCSKRHENDTHIPDCPNRHRVAKAHAKMLIEAGFDYISVDITNWPQINTATDVAVIRPLENLFDMWLELRAQGIPTPSIVMWCVSPVAVYNDGHETTWQHLLTHFYNNATRSSLIWKDPFSAAVDLDSAVSSEEMGNGINGINGIQKKIFMIPDNGNYNQTVSNLIQANGGLYDISIIKVWALFGSDKYHNGTWGFFSPCIDEKTKSYTTSMVGVNDCNQYSSNNTQNQVVEISASGGYMLSQCALPFAASGHMRGLTLQRLFQKVLRVGANQLFMSSFNEFIGGRQKAAYSSNVAFNMGLPNDPQRDNVWVDTYGVEYSRDIEPSVEGGSMIYNVAKDCIHMYKQGLTCEENSAENESSSSIQSIRPCCSTKDTKVWHNVWSLINSQRGDRLLTNSATEKKMLIGVHAFKEVCHSINGPSVFCVDTSIKDGRDGPFMLYNNGSVLEQSGTLKAVYRCYSNTTGVHWLSSDSVCNERTGGHMESILGWAAGSRGGGTLRELFRCEGKIFFSHALDIGCLHNTTIATISLGFVR